MDAVAAGLGADIDHGVADAGRGRGEDAVGPGDWVLIHVGFAMSKIDEAEAAATLELLTGLGQAYTDELTALAESDIS